MEHALKTASTSRPVARAAAGPAPGKDVRDAITARPPPGRCACGGTCPRCQAKSSLTIGAAGDAFEREADAIANHVMGGAPPRSAPVAPAPPALQRKCAACASDDEWLTVQKKAGPTGTAGADPAPHVDAALGTAGQPLDGASRRFFDSRFGHDFSSVRIHADSTAAQSARGLGALAYTVGSDIVFGAGQFAPATHAGQHLLAHELTHVIQQGGGAAATNVPSLQRQEGGDDSGFETGQVDPSTNVATGPTEFGERNPDSPCPRVPTHLGDMRPDPPCDTAAVGPIVGTHFRFCMDSDVFVDGRQLTFLRSFARSQRADSLFNVHGFSSTDGDAAYNMRLSCHRARRAARELQNAGVPSQQIRVAALGETNQFGPTQADNRTVVIGAEAPAGQVTPDASQPATSLRDAADKAIGRILARDYRLAADAYVARWTCGTIPTVAEMVRRTTVLTEGENSRAAINRVNPDPSFNPRLGTPHRTGLREIVLAREVFTEADAPVLCAAARIIDMAFHHFLAPRLGTGPMDMDAVHPASIFLVELAGFPPCVKPASFVPGDPPLPLSPAESWWDPPTADPLASRPTNCPRQALPGPLQVPAGGGAATPLTFTTTAFDLQGSATTIVPRIDAARNSVSVNTPRGAFQFRATVQAAGDPRQFPRYQVGFLQTIVADARAASYVSGDTVHSSVPTPMRDGPPGNDAPPPWFMPPRARPLDSAGQATTDLSDSPSMQMPLVYMDLTRMGPRVHPATIVQAGNDLNRATLRTTFNTWLVARRDDAPLDPFSTHFIRGHQTTVAVDLDMLDRRGDASQVSTVGAAQLTDSSPMQVAGPTAADMAPLERISHITPPTPRGQVTNAADAAEIRRQVRLVADELAPLREALHLDGPVMVRVRFDRVSGRLVLDTPQRTASTIEETGAADEREGVSESARAQLAREFTVRLRKDLVAAPGVPDLSQGFPTSLAALRGFAARRQRARVDPNPWSPGRGIGLLGRMREAQQQQRSDDRLRTNPRVYDPAMFPRVNVTLALENYCFNFGVSGLDISSVCQDESMRTEGCVIPLRDPAFKPRAFPAFTDQELAGETFHSPIGINVIAMPLHFNLFTPREHPGGDTFNHEMHHMIDSRNMVQALKDRLARRIRARLMELRAQAADHPDLRDTLLSRSVIQEIVEQEHKVFVEFFRQEFLGRGDAMHTREGHGPLPSYRSELPPDWTGFREPPFIGGTKGSLDDKPCD